MTHNQQRPPSSLSFAHYRDAFIQRTGPLTRATVKAEIERLGHHYSWNNHNHTVIAFAQGGARRTDNLEDALYEAWKAPPGHKPR